MRARSSPCWHPFTLGENALPIVKAKGQYLFGRSGRKYFDAISSWWTCTHGHRHPSIMKAVREQLGELDHVLFAGYTHPSAETCASRLINLLPGDQQKVFFSDNGSTAVEVGIKIALQYFKNKGKKRSKIIALKGGYHGDTFGAMSAGISSGFFSPFQELLFDVELIHCPVQGVLSEKEQERLKKLSRYAAAFVYEPLIQGSAGMKLLSPIALDQILNIFRQNEVVCIADEVFTGFGRTGTLFASEQLRTRPDIYCFSKGLTGGAMALGATTVSRKIFSAFKSNNPESMFRHGHSYTANPIACAAAAAALELHTAGKELKGVAALTSFNKTAAAEAATWKGIRSANCLGTILALEVKTSGSYFDRPLSKAIPFFQEKGIIIRPLGNVVYWVPPYCSSRSDLMRTFETMNQFMFTLR